MLLVDPKDSSREEWEVVVSSLELVGGVGVVFADVAVEFTRKDNLKRHYINEALNTELCH